MAAPETRSNIDRLHAMLKEIGVESKMDELEETKDYTAPRAENHNDRPTPQTNSSRDEDEETAKLLKNLEYDFEDEDSWLYESPQKGSPEKKTESPEKWTCSDLSTPELNRVRGALSSKLDLITLENRRDQFDSLVNKHNLKSPSIPSSKQEYGSQSADMGTLDWEYDEDYITHQDDHMHPKQAWADEEAYDDNESRPFTLDFPEHEYDDLKPMTLDFESPSSGRLSGHAVSTRSSSKLRRTSSGGTSQRHLDNSDLAVDVLVATPTGNIRPRPSKYQFERSDSQDSDSARGNAAFGSDQSDVESIGSNYSDSGPVQPRGSSRPSAREDTSAMVRPRGGRKDLSNNAVSRGGSGSNLSSGLTAKPTGLVRPRTSPSSGDASLRVNAPSNGVTRPRGSAQASPGSSLVAPRGMVRGNNKSSSPSNSDSGSPASQPRTSLPQPRRSSGIASPKSLPVARPRRSRSKSPEPMAGKVYPRGAASRGSLPNY